MTHTRTAMAAGIALIAVTGLTQGALQTDAPAATPMIAVHADDAYEIVEQAAKALNKVHGFTAQVEVGAKGELSQMLPAAKARIRALRPAIGGNELKPAPLMVRVTGEGRRASTQALTKVDVVFRDGKFFWLDDEAKVLRERFPRVARDRQVQIARDFLSKDIFEGEPFARLLKHEGLTLDERATVDGVVCDVVLAELGGGTRTERFYFGTDDHLVRKIETTFNARGIKGSMFTIFTKLKVNPSLAPVAFELDLPEGYTREADTRVVNPRLSARPDRLGRPTPAERRDAARPLRMATDFSLQTPDGSQIALHDLRGSIVVLDFWGTWLPSSLRAAPELQKLHEDYKDKSVRVLGLNFRERDPQRAIDHMTSNNLTYDILMGAEQAVRDYRVVQFPTYIIIGTKGEIIKEINGYQPQSTFNEIRKTIDVYLEEQAASAKPTATEQTGETPTAESDATASDNDGGG